jgi:hypothetical protein
MYLSVFMPEQSAAEKMYIHRSVTSDEVKKLVKNKNAQCMRQRRREHKSKNNVDVNMFPPEPPSDKLSEKIARKFCEATSPSSFEEASCAVCGQLVQKSKLVLLDEAKCNFDILSKDTAGFTRVERLSSDDPIKDIPGPILDQSCDSICKRCYTTIKQNKLPKFALARGLWIGSVPCQLQDLQYFECLLIARVRHN